MARVCGCLLPILVGALCCVEAWGHAGGHTGYASITVNGRQVRYSLQLSSVSVPPAIADQMKLGQEGLVPDLEPLLAVVHSHIRLTNDGTPCEAGPGAVVPPPPEIANITLIVDFVCAGRIENLKIRDDLPDILGADYHTLAHVAWPGGSQQFAFAPDNREAVVTVDAPPEAARGAGSFFPMGVEHILTGYDHLLFLLALMLRGGNLWSLLKIVTAFTIAHSITLALAALDIVTLPSRLVEATIALSIAYVAAENLFLRKAASHRWAVSFLFGLVHGFGFSSVLRNLGLPREGLIWSLLNFNLGVETGQAAAILVALPALIWIRRSKWENRVITVLSAIVLVVGLVLFVDRAVL
ncbi:MAG: hypothetical protein GC151_18285 [Betaproteobacteria bacterium]|nr:hypothetical protein [Betaproteobacteria bacterium]